MRIHRNPKPIPMKIISTWSDGTTDTEKDYENVYELYESVRTYRTLFKNKIECKHGTITNYAAYLGSNLIEKNGRKYYF